MENMLVYPQSFLELQLIFAKKVAELAQQPFEFVLLHYTALYRIFGLDWTFDATNPIWQAYVRELQQEKQLVEWTYQFYLTRYHVIPKFTDSPHWGCFSYEYEADSHSIHLEFSNQDTSGYGALSRHRIGTRRDELKRMFIHVKQTHPDAASARGGSWLYNLESYRRLFPSEYGLSAQVVAPNFQARALWGQFLRHNWQMNEQRLQGFLLRVSQLKDVQMCSQCFPYQMLGTEAPIGFFYDFYSI